MARNHDRERSQALFQKLQYITAPSRTADMPFALSPRELRKMKKFRFQLLHRWLVRHFAPYI